MMHFEAQSKIQEKLKQEQVTQEELEEGHVELKMGESSNSAHKKPNKRANRKS